MKINSYFGQNVIVMSDLGHNTFILYLWSGGG